MLSYFPRVNLLQRFIAPWRTPLVQAASYRLDGTDQGDRDKYRRLTAQNRDLQPLKLQRIQNLSYALWQRNPLARRLVSILIDFTIGTDFSVKAVVRQPDAEGNLVEVEDMPEVQEAWETSWADPYDGLSDEFPEVITDYFLNGELAIIPSKNPINGRITWGFINPVNIIEVATDPLNAFAPTAIKVQGEGMTEPKVLKVIVPDMNPESATFGRLMGDVLFFRTNKLISQSRGCGELAEMIDWIDLLEKFQWNALEAAEVRNTFFYHERREGATQEQLDALPAPAPPKTAQVIRTNEKVTYDIKNPDLSSYETDRLVKTYKTWVLGGKGYPDWFFGDGGETNLATAAEMSRPTMQMFKRKQREVKTIAQRIAMYVLDQAIIAGTIKPKDDMVIDVEVSAYDFDRKDAASVGAGFVQVVTALKMARDSNWIDDQTAKTIVDGVVTGLGASPDPSKTVDDIAEENGEKKASQPYLDLPLNEFLKDKKNGDMPTKKKEMADA